MNQLSGLLLLLMVILSACSKAALVDDPDKVVHIHTEDTLFYSQFIESYTVIDLEDHPDAILGEILRITRVDSDRLLIFGNSGRKPVLFLYKNDGTFICQIGKAGRGPGEYLSPHTYVLQMPEGIVHIYDVYERAIHKYTLDGKFVEKLHIDLIIEDFTITQTGNYIYYSSFEENNMINEEEISLGIYLADSRGKFIRIIHQIDWPDKIQAFNQKFFNRAEVNGILFSSFSDRVYSFEGDSLNLRLSIDFGKKRLPDSERAKTSLNDFSTEYVILKSTPIESSRYLIFTTLLSFVRKAGYCLIDKNEMTGAHYSVIQNDISHSRVWFVGSTDTEFFASVQDDNLNLDETILNRIHVFKVKE